jgi:hypothetical protein
VNISRPLRNTLALAVWLGLCLAVGARESRPLNLLFALAINVGPGLLTAAGTAAGFWAIGGPLRARLVPHFAKGDPATGALLDFGLGLSVLLAVTSLLGSFGLLLPIAAQALFLGGLIAAGVRLERERPKFLLAIASTNYALLPLLALGLLLPCLFMIAAPPLAADEVQYHLRFVEHLLRTGSVPADPQDPLSGFALGLHCLATLPASIAGIAALRPFGLLLGLAGLLGGERLYRRVFGPGRSWIYLLVALSAVSLVRVFPTFNTDLPLAGLVALIALLALDWTQSADDPGGRPWAIAILGGAALSIKFTAPFFIAPFYLVVILAILWNDRESGRGRLLLQCAFAAVLPLLFALPWLLKNQATTGHPLYPLLGMSFPEGAPTAFAFNFDRHYGPGKSLIGMIRAPWDLFILGTEFDRRHFMGRMGIWPIVAVPGMVYAARHNRQAFLLCVACLVGFLLWAGILLRAVYLLPLWPVLAALTAGGLAQLLPARASSGSHLASGVLAISLLAGAVAELAPAWQDQLDSVSVAVGDEPIDDYILRELPEAGALRWLRRNTKAEEGVAQFWTWAWWDLPNRLIWPGAEDFTPLRARLVELGTSSAVLTALRASQVRWVFYRRPVLLRGSYPGVTDADWERGFGAALALSDELVHDHLILRYEEGPYQVYEVP